MMRRTTALLGVFVMSTTGMMVPRADGASVTIRACIYNAGRHSNVVSPSSGSVTIGLDMSRDGSRILFDDISNGSRLRLRTRATGAVVDVPTGVDRYAAWSSDLRRVAAVVLDGSVQRLTVFDLATSSSAVVLSVPSTSALFAESISDDGTQVVFTVADPVARVVKRIDVGTQIVTAISAADGATYDRISASADGRFVVAVRNSVEVWLYDAQAPSATLLGAGARALVNPGGTVVAWAAGPVGPLHLFDIASGSDSVSTLTDSLVGAYDAVPVDMSFDGRFLLVSGGITGVTSGTARKPLVYDRQTGSLEPFGVGSQPDSVGAAISDGGTRALIRFDSGGSPDIGLSQAYVVDRGATTVYGGTSAASGGRASITIFGNSLPTTLDGYPAPAGMAFGRLAPAGAHAVTLWVDSWPRRDGVVRLTLTGPNGCRVNAPVVGITNTSSNFGLSQKVFHPGQRINTNATETPLGPALTGIDAGSGISFVRHDTPSGNFDAVVAAMAPTGLRTVTLKYGNTGNEVVPRGARVRSTAGEYHPVTASRLTRRTLFGGMAQSLPVAGRLGVPASGVQSVVLNVTVTSPSASGSLSVYPAGTARPSTSTAVYAPTRYASNMVVSKLGANGAVNLLVDAGRALVTVDVVGWFSASGSSNRTGLAIDPQPPVRAYDSRQHGARPAAGSTFFLPDWGGGVGVLASVTVIAPATSGELLLRPGHEPSAVAFPDGPVTVAFRAGQTVTNLALVPAGQFSELEVVTSASAHFVVDIVGVVQPQTSIEGELVRAIAPTRVLNAAPLSGGVVRHVGVLGLGGVPTYAKSVLVNLTSTNTAASGSVMAWSSGWTRPSTSNLNTVRGSAASTLALVPVGVNGRISVYSSTATALTIEVVGYTVTG
jgi:hypothetical protein